MLNNFICQQVIQQQKQLNLQSRSTSHNDFCVVLTVKKIKLTALTYTDRPLTIALSTASVSKRRAHQQSMTISKYDFPETLLQH